MNEYVFGDNEKRVVFRVIAATSIIEFILKNRLEGIRAEEVMENTIMEVGDLFMNIFTERTC